MERPDKDVTGVPRARQPEGQNPAGNADPVPAAAPIVDELTDRERDMLDFEAQWWRQPGAKEQAIRDRFEQSPTRYYQLLNALLERPAALAYEPGLVNRLRRVRANQTRRR
ncbi:MAG: hypothetical protein QOI74_951 [Micromonosporaceae bacterium]|jgi:hypothetical protein|nr:hypothetical protein [Micromonosporaceae bacterium]